MNSSYPSDDPLPISEIGEKRLIREVIRPLFNPSGTNEGVGDDCAQFELHPGTTVLASTDRVPADLIAFRAGLIGYRGLGRYLAVLNISDICASGGTPVCLLFNAGLPTDLLLGDFKALCEGLGDEVALSGAKVLGGDISVSNELSLSATSIGYCLSGTALVRSGARAGDSIFLSRQVGLTSSAFRCLALNIWNTLSPSERQELSIPFTSLGPMMDLGKRLAASGLCSSCMDNTDGIGQTLYELSEASGCAFIVDEHKLPIPDVVTKVAMSSQTPLIDLALGPGADFSLVGTLSGSWEQAEATRVFGEDIQIVGHVEPGDGTYIQNVNSRSAVNIPGWNYFMSNRGTANTISDRKAL